MNTLLTDWKSVAQSAIARGLIRTVPPQVKPMSRFCEWYVDNREKDLAKRRARRRANQAMGLRYDGKSRTTKRWGLNSQNMAEYMRAWRKLRKERKRYENTNRI